MSKVETVYLIHHSHTDIGYTHDQPIVWDLHGRFIEEGSPAGGQICRIRHRWGLSLDGRKYGRAVRLAEAGRRRNRSSALSPWKRPGGSR